jgi:hypothetical protein
MKYPLILAFVPLLASAQTFIVKDGVPRAEIIISRQPTRMQRVAAHEFREQIHKISGAKLPILNRPSGSAVKVFVGASEWCPLKADGLENGAYRISGSKDSLVLIGDDTDCSLTEPYAKNNGDIPRAEQEWREITRSNWSLHSPGLYKNKLRLPGDVGKPDGSDTPKNEFLEVWGTDERGSFNAVCGFLRKLGARWYMPGELGEVLPALGNIEVPEIDETVRPDFSLRQFNFRFGIVGWPTALWTMRLGTRNDEKLLIAHGMDTMTGNDATFAAHPEWFALYGEKRDYKSGDSKNQLCYSNEELFRETVRFARETFDRYPFKSVSIMPPDGFTAMCQCGACKGKNSPERDERGSLSDYVWDFVNRVAKEVGKTHPHGKIINCAYGSYTLPPQKIDKLEPNIVVGIVGGRRPVYKGSGRGWGGASPEALRSDWTAKSAQPVFVFENYPFTDRGWYLPSFVARTLGDTINATKGVSSGEDIWLTVRQDFDTANIGFNHFLVYFTARAYWGGATYDAGKELQEYVKLFYGPAEHEMLEFFEYCEQHYAAMDESKAKADEALALFEKAKSKADPMSVFGKRLALIDDFLKGLRMRSVQLAQKRGPVPTLRLVGETKGIVVDGKLDEDCWVNCPVSATGTLRELQTGRLPTFATTFKTAWQGNSVCFAIRCAERLGDKPNNTSAGDDDQAIWYGDAVEIELGTETHSYYQIAVSPNGHLVDLDRGAPKASWFGWDSKAEVATQVAADHWTVEIRIPVTQDESDPLHQVVGRKPIQTLPWHVNICRQRIRNDGREYSAFSPTGTDGFHEPMKFAHFYDGRSHVFEDDPNFEDFLTGFQKAIQQRKAEAFLALAAGNVTAYQKSAALEQAARLDREATFIPQIPLEAVRKTALMLKLIANAKAHEVTQIFSAEDFSKWPFWKRGDGLHARGWAYMIAKDGQMAEADLNAALEWIADPRSRDSALVLVSQNREMNLGDDEGALHAYFRIVEGRTQLRSFDELTALEGIARIQARRGDLEVALKTIEKAKPDQLEGTWKNRLLKLRGEISARIN